MIIGDGSIARLLNDREGFVFFAAGISKSQGIIPYENRMKEASGVGIQMGLSNHSNAMFVYFSTISIFTINSDYTRHKVAMEESVRRSARNYTIIRLGNVWECTNPNTFINAYKRQPYEPRDEWKYMISKKQLNFITDNLPRTGQHEICVFGEMLKAAQCVKNTEYL